MTKSNGRDPFRDLLEQLQQREQSEQASGNGNLTPSLEGGSNDPGNGDGEEVIREEAPQFGGRRLIWSVVLFLLIMLSTRLLGYFTDWLWFDSLDLTSVYVTRILASGTTFLVSSILFWLLLAGNIWLASRINRRTEGSTLDSTAQQMVGFRVTPLLYVGSAVLAVMSGLAMMSLWEEILLYLNQVEFGLADPIFNRDVGFFVFSLPIWQAVRSLLLTAFVFALIGTMLVNGFNWRQWFEDRRVKTHLSLLVVAILLLLTWQYRLQSFDLVYSNRGAVFGAGFTDVNAQLPIYQTLFFVTLAIAALVLVNIFLKFAWKVIVYVLGIWVVVAVLAGNFVPNLIQRFVVNPNEFIREEPYIERNIALTRKAYNLDTLESVAFNARETLTLDDLTRENETIANIRLWDYRPMRISYNQLQVLRQYYEFQDIDIDRYVVDGTLKQVLLAARELDPRQLSGEAQTWVNERLVFTHGYGVAASPVAEITFDGNPTFILKDLPPKGSIPVEKPQLYFSELSHNYVIVNTDTEEFDYPSEEGNVFTRFDADSGIRIGNFLTRLAFTIRFADTNLLLTGAIGPESRLLWKRNIYERLQEIAPFLVYDDDPYIVIGDDGGLYWFVDAYTTSLRFPYSQPSTLNRPLNYIRNSVKVIINAYDGEVDFYLVDESDPIVAAYQKVFPRLFTDFAEMPDGLRSHIRFPQDLFTVQARILTVYHMTEPNEFYNREDVWQWPQEYFDNQPREMEPYYVLMQLPGSDQLDFNQILPFTPANRKNMIAWFAAKSNPDEYGEKLLVTFGKDSLVYGPEQIEARIDQDPTISAQLSLWNQQGSQVIRGNLLVIPLGNSLLYVEPLYLQAAAGIPELKRVIVAANDRVVMAPNLGLALVEVFGEGLLDDEVLADLVGEGALLEPSPVAETPSEPAEPAAQPQPDVSVPPLVELEGASLAQLIVAANDAYATAIQAQQAGDWAGYGDALARLEAVLAQLAEEAGSVQVESADT